MPRAKRLIAGAKSISARNINKAIEQANRTDSFQGGTGLTSANDPTGMQMINARRNPTPDGNSPFGLSTSITSAIEFPTRKTLKMRSDATRHKKEWELFGSSGVSQKAIAPSSSRPQRYGIPHLPTSSSGSGSLTWGTMDADEFGTSGPRSIERRSSTSGERFQMYGFDAAAITLDSSEVTQTPVRRRYGSSGNHYIAWVNSSDLEGGGGATVPRWDQIQNANQDVQALHTGSSDEYDFRIGSFSNRWSVIALYAQDTMILDTNGDLSISLGSSASHQLSIVGLKTTAQGGTDVWLSSSGYLRIG